MSVRLAVAVVFFQACSLASAGDFLGPRQRFGSREISAELVGEAVRNAKVEVSAALKNELSRMYKALPKNEHGLVDPATARYAMHRHFVEKYGWYMRGVDPKGEHWNSTGSAAISKDRLPQHIQSLFSKDGMNLDDLAVFASVLSSLMEEEVDAGVEEIYAAMNYSSEDMSDTDFDFAVKAYLARVILGGDAPVTSPEDAYAVISELESIYPTWGDTVMWSEDSIRAHDWLERDRLNPFVRPTRTYERAIRCIRNIMHHFGHLGDEECAVAKRELVEFEIAGTGRLSLPDFYTDRSRKRESVEYLRNIGVLDETEGSIPTVLIANMMVSTTNCLIDASYYSSCCKNECEGLMSHLEEVLAAPDATPGQVAELVAKLPSDTVNAPRNLSSALLDRLQAVADHHHGRVPLHGRLFAQWMHHAYPLECPYPQLSGSFAPMTQDEFMVHYDVDDVFVPEVDIEEHIAMLRKQQAGMQKVKVRWDSTEELVAHHRVLAKPTWKLSSLRVPMAFLAFASMAWPLVQSSKKLLNPVDHKTTHLV